MSVIADVVRVRELVRKTMILDVLREFPGLTEEELRSGLKGWLEPPTERDIREHGLLTPEESDSDVSVDRARLKPLMPPEELQQRPRLYGQEKPIVKEAQAVRMIEDLAPNIPPEKLERHLYVMISAHRRTDSEIGFNRQTGYFPEQHPYKTKAEVEYCARHGVWPPDRNKG